MLPPFALQLIEYLGQCDALWGAFEILELGGRVTIWPSYTWCSIIFEQELKTAMADSNVHNIAMHTVTPENSRSTSTRSFGPSELRRVLVYWHHTLSLLCHGIASKRDQRLITVFPNLCKDLEQGIQVIGQNFALTYTRSFQFGLDHVRISSLSPKAILSSSPKTKK